ncbi:MAG: aminoacyl-tRNA hydrolase [bacterium]
MKILIGLGNPGETYQHTRHNIGFLVIDALKEAGEFGKAKRAAQAILYEGAVGGTQVLLAKPLNYMNRSGLSVARIVERNNLRDLKGMMVICDDANLPWGQIRVRGTGSAGGHHGLESIANMLGSLDFPRMRLGIGGGDTLDDLTEHVLTPFTKKEQESLPEFVARARDACILWIERGLDAAMRAFNKPAPDSA